MNKNRKIYVIALFVFLGIILAGVGAHIVRTKQFNDYHYTSVNPEEDTCYSTLVPRAGESWMKQDAIVDGRHVPLIGSTYDLTFYNATPYTVDEWSYRIDINSPCYVNQNWNGMLEIHQGNKTKTLALKSSMSGSLDEIMLDYNIVGQDLLIGLLPGDYIVYIPDETMEKTVAKMTTEPTTVSAGIIFYSDRPITFSNCVTTYSLHKAYLQGSEAVVFAGLLILWAMLAIGGIASYVSTFRSQRFMENKLRALSSYDELFDYIFNLEMRAKTYQTVKSRKRIVDEAGTTSKLFEYLVEDAEPLYYEAIREFLKEDDLFRRVKERENLVFEYKSVTNGWIKIRFIVMEPEKNQDTLNVIFTIRIINKEHEELEKNERAIEKLTSENRLRGEYIKDMTDRLIVLAEVIEKNCDDLFKGELSDSQKDTLSRIHGDSQILDSALEAVRDYTNIMDNVENQTKFDFTLEELLREVLDVISVKAEKRNIEIAKDITAKTDTVLRGDYLRLKSILLNLLYFVVLDMNGGTITLCVYGKEEKDRQHLLFSIKDDGKSHEIDMSSMEVKVCNTILGAMNSEIKFVNVENQKNDMYFTVNQRIIRSHSES